jgi:surfeit locus 1 family protein
MRKPPLLPTFLTLISLAILCSLGTWQIKRLQWKEEILSQIDSVYNKDPSENIFSYDFLTDSIDNGKIIIDRGTIKGRYIYSKEIKIGPRTHEGKSGYHIITPFALDDGGGILVNRGWAPLDWENQKSDKQFKINVSGTLRMPETPGKFVPENEPDKDQWYQINIKEISNKAGLPFEIMSPYILYAESQEKADKFPIPHDANWRPNNNHLQYVVFWFSMAFILIIIFYIRFIKNQEEISAKKHI